MSTEKASPADVLVLEDEERIRAYVHPTRMNILSILARAPMTTTGLARELGVHPANLTRHLRLLLRTGLIRLVETRDTGRNLEKYYRAAARAYEVRLAADRVEDRRAIALAIVRDDLSSAVATATGERSGPVVALLGHVRLPPGRVRTFERRLARLLDEFRALDTHQGVPYGLALALYPGETVGDAEKEVRL